MPPIPLMRTAGPCGWRRPRRAARPRRLRAETPDAGQRHDALPGVTVTATRAPSLILATPLAITTISAPELRVAARLRARRGAHHGAGRGGPVALRHERRATGDPRLRRPRAPATAPTPAPHAACAYSWTGFPETEPDGRTAFDQIDLGAAEGVEVIRSNASAVWGNAAGGVINVRTVPSAPRARVRVPADVRRVRAGALRHPDVGARSGTRRGVS